MLLTRYPRLGTTGRNARRLLQAVVLLSLVAVPGRAAAQDATTVLAGIREQILLASPQVAAATATVEVFRSRLAAVGFGGPVSLSLEAEEIPGGVRFHDAGSTRLVAEKTFLPAGVGGAARQQAQGELDAALVRLDATQAVVLAGTDVALARAIGWGVIADRLAEQDVWLQEAERALETRFAVAETGYVDVLRLRTERLRVQAARSDAEAASRAARSDLEAFLPPTDSAARLALTTIDALVADPSTRVVELLLRPPPSMDTLVARAAVVRLANTEVEQARASQASVTASQRPQLSGFLGGQRFLGEGGGHTFGPVVGVTMSLPFTARQSNRAAREAASRSVTEAEARVSAAHAELRAGVSAALERYRAAGVRLDLFDAALLDGVRAEREGALEAYRTEQLTLTELMDFERSLSAAEASRIESMISVVEALADIANVANAVGDAPTSSPLGGPSGGS